MAGPKANIAKGWTAMREGLNMDPPTPVDRCLGCFHHIREGRVNGSKVRSREWDVCDFMSQCVQAYRNACGEPDMHLKKVDTPFIASTEGGGYAPRPLAEGEAVGALQLIAC